MTPPKPITPNTQRAVGYEILPRRELQLSTESGEGQASRRRSHEGAGCATNTPEGVYIAYDMGIFSVTISVTIVDH